MGNFNDIGQLKELPLDNISVKNKPNDIFEYLILGIASEIGKNGNYNPVPVIVTSTGSYEYEVVSNHLTYYACKHLGLEKIYCIVVENDNKIKRLCKILNSELSPKINLTTASREEIASSLRYVKEQFKLSKFDIQKATIRITDSPLRKYWRSLDDLIDLKCGINEKNTDLFKNIYELHPFDRPKINLTTATREEIASSLQYVKEQFKLSKFDIQKATIQISDSIRKYWTSIDELMKLKCGINEKNINLFNNIYELHPFAQPKEPSKVFILNASEKEIRERLTYLKEVYSSDFTNVDIEIATKEIRNSINSIGKKKPKAISFLTKLDVGIDKKCIGWMKEIFLIE
ncbi:MAG: hypothetical protein KBF99_07180 [Leptospiraceae bacterium]|nr:hypothetical protein [Leptospiraceae bacterium]MBP9162948.1 hypothetical protein [Leptospiraceae bacterium]